ncbi:MAG: hypothetical protein R3E73_12860 [Porticoccaceae bacterium]|nr:hypothetical protein [Pseudomonadales bacterium]MCP5171821.1 hypothetical protein [Pseudomonadales bacterium]
MLGWASEHHTLLTWLGVVSFFVFVFSLASLPWLVSRIPEDYFSHQERTPTRWKKQHPVIRLLLLIGKNLLGVVLLCGGILMLVLPGQGLLTILMGVLLLDYPGKYTLERKVVSQPGILKSLNWLRAKAKHPPLIIDEP